MDKHPYIIVIKRKSGLPLVSDVLPLTPREALAVSKVQVEMTQEHGILVFELADESEQVNYIIVPTREITSIFLAHPDMYHDEGGHIPIVNGEGR